MLSFDIRSLESAPERVDNDLAPDDPVWEEGDPRPSAPLHVTGRVSSAGAGRFYFSGHVEGSVGLECRRCLVDVNADPHAPELDLRPAIREEWLLSVPAFVLCREDCRGLCATCGADLNEDPSHSHEAADPRWDALRGLVGVGLSLIHI